MPIRKLGREVLALATEMTDQTQVQQLIEAAWEHFGQLNIPIDNASQTAVGFVAEAPVALFRQVFEFNVLPRFMPYRR